MEVFVGANRGLRALFVGDEGGERGGEQGQARAQQEPRGGGVGGRRARGTR